MGLENLLKTNSFFQSALSVMFCKAQCTNGERIIERINLISIRKNLVQLYTISERTGRTIYVLNCAKQWPKNDLTTSINSYISTDDNNKYQYIHIN
uniref:Uncharacterized protein n=1 Tax=Arion vulgaris TaxID=1028688 RepID=A0A0B7AH51_9EUPU